MKLRLSLLLCSLSLMTSAFGATIAYVDPTGIGNQGFTGSLGMDFNVNSAITVTALGAFDSGQDGFTNAVTVSIYDRATGLIVPGLSLSIFGTPGIISGGDRIVSLSPVILPSGFQGSIVASGFNSTNQNGNSLSASNYSTTNTGGGLISFVGTSRFDGVAGVYPNSLDGAVARYGAGTFQFAATTVPEPATFLFLGAGLAALGFARRKR